MIALVVLAIIVLIILYYTGRGKKCSCGCGCEEGRCTCPKCKCPKCHEKWTVYGTEWCGWTTKQLDYMKKNGKAHDFIDCEKEQCDGRDSFPTLVNSNGEKLSGYNEI